jgi:alpha-L-fucosidase
LLLNVPPNRDGLLSPADATSLGAFGQALRDLHHSRRQSELAGDRRTIILPYARPIDHVSIQEQIETGQHIARHAVDRWDGSRWVALVEGTTIGHKRLHRFAPVTAARLRIRILESLGPAVISDFACFSSTG